MMETLERIMDETHDRWQANNWSYEQFLGNLTTKEVVVVAIAKLNYQVENGGFYQWFENGYGKQSGVTLDSLKAVGTEAAKEVIELVRKAVRIRESAEWTGREGDDFDDYDKLDDAYYEKSEALLKDLEAWASTTATV